MSSHTYYFAPIPEMGALRASLARHFAVNEERVFIYLDSSDVFGSAARDRQEHLYAAYCASAVTILLRNYETGTGPISGWLTVEVADQKDVDDHSLALAMAAATGVRFFYHDPIPDPKDVPSAQAAQIEVQPSGELQKVWVIEYGGADSRTMTDVSAR